MFDLLTEMIRDALRSPSEAIPLPPGLSDPGVENALDALEQAAQAVDNAPGLSEWADATEEWRSRLEELAESLYGASDEAVERLTAYVVMERLPRTAGALILAGVIENHGTPDEPDWWLNLADLFDFITDPETLVNEQRWEDLFEDIGRPASGRLPAVLAGLLIMSPRAILSIVDGQLRIAGPPPPPVRGGPGTWQDFRDNTEDWVSLTLALGDPAQTPQNRTPSSSYDLAPGLAPDLSGTVAIRSARRTQDGDSVTDFEMWVGLGVDDDHWEYPLGAGWLIRVEPGISAGFGRDGAQDTWHGAFAPLQASSPHVPARDDDPVSIRLIRENPNAVEDYVFGPRYDTRVVIGDVEAFMNFRQAEPVFEIGAFAKDVELVIAPRFWRDFGVPSQTFREGWRFGVDLSWSYGVGVGSRFNLSSGIDVLVVFDDAVFGTDDGRFDIKFHSVHFVGEILVEDGQAGIRVNALLHTSVKLGPVVVVADGFGAWGGSWPFGESGSLYYGRYWGLVPPTGVGLEIDFGSIKGGGFADWRGGPTRRYAGLLNLIVEDTFDIVAFGIHEKTPQDKTSFVGVLGVRFTPGIQLGYGFAITGFGGIVAINRRLDTDALRERLTSGAVGNVLFAPDPVRNAPTILGDLGFLFPATDGVHVAGPTMRISWAKVILHFDFGVLVEFATSSGAYGMKGITKLVLIGSAHADSQRWSEDPEAAKNLKGLVKLQLDFAGFWDRPAEIVEIDAGLVSSKILWVLDLTGDAAFRLSYGEESYAVLSLGGFHPDFNPEPAQFPEMARIGVAYKIDKSFELFLRFEFYYAVSTSAVMTGALVEAGWAVGPVNASGYLAYDALIEFSPFSFSVAFSAGMRIRYKAFNLAGIRVRGIIAGPGPITITGEFCFSVLFFDFCWDHTFELPPAYDVLLSAIVEPIDVIQSALSDPTTLTTVGFTSRGVALTSEPTSHDGGQVISPNGRLQWSQSLLPLSTTLERYEGRELPNGPRKIEVAVVGKSTNEIREGFAPGLYFNLTKSEKLNRATFERLPSGFALGLGMSNGSPVVRQVSVKTYVIPERREFVAVAATFPMSVLNSVDGRTESTSQFPRDETEYGIGAEGWAAYTSAGREVANSQTEAHTIARHGRGIALPVDDVVTTGAF